MPPLRIALAQVDLVVGDLAGNAETVLRWSERAVHAGAHLVAFPEMALTGYPPEDLVLRPSFAAASRRTLHDLATRLGDELPELAVVVGHLDRDDIPDADGSGRRQEPWFSGAGPRNAVSLLHRGTVAATYFKHHLPNYGVFDEDRYFVPGTVLPVVRLHGVDVAMTVCEDMWQPGGSFDVAGAAGAGLNVCVNGSPYERGKSDHRVELARRRVASSGVPVAYVNTVGGQDELVFDGDSFVMGADGELLARAPQFEETLLLADLDLAPAREPAGSPGDRAALTVQRVTLTDAPLAAVPPPLPPTEVAPRLPDEEEVWRAVVTGTRDYVEKNRFATVVLGLSGGIDSAVVATIAADAVGPDRVHVVAMPSKYSSAGSLTDAADLADRQRLHYSVVDIVAVVEGFHASLAGEGGLHGLAEENLQARVRGTTLMALSNEHGHLVLTTGNKSELATGFSTLYGDSAGGFAPIKDVPKSLVWRLARWRNAAAEHRGETPPIPASSITKAPSAELAPGQVDSDRLPSYDLLDALLEDYVEGDLGYAELVAAGHDPGLVERVIRLVDAAEYKRRQNPPGPKITPRAFGRDRRLPITSRWREAAAPGPAVRVL